MDLLKLSFSVIGAFAGLLLWSHLAKVVFGVLAGARNGSPLGELTEQKIRKVLGFLFVASLAWVLAFGFLAYSLALPQASEGWRWFFGGMGAAPLFAWSTTIGALRKIKRLSAQQAPP